MKYTATMYNTQTFIPTYVNTVEMPGKGRSSEKVLWNLQRLKHFGVKFHRHRLSNECPRITWLNCRAISVAKPERFKTILAMYGRENNYLHMYVNQDRKPRNPFHWFPPRCVGLLKIRQRSRNKKWPFGNEGCQKYVRKENLSSSNYAV